MERLRVATEEAGTTIELVHPTSRGWLIASFAIVLAAIGTLGGFLILRAMEAPAPLMMLLFPVGMLSMIFLPFAAFMAPWLSSGIETAVVSQGALTVRTTAWGIPWSARRFAVSAISAVRFQPLPNLNRKLMHSIVMDPGDLAFDYGGRTVRFGKWLQYDDGVAAAQALEEALDSERMRPISAQSGGVMELPPARHQVIEYDGGVEIRMPFGNTPVTRRSLLVSFGGMFLAMPVLGLLMGSTFSATGESQGFALLMTVVPLATVLVIVVPIMLVSLAAKERVRLSGGVLEIKTRPVLLTLLPARRFDTRYIHNLRYEPVIPSQDDLVELWSKYLKGNYGHIAFGYGAEQHRFGQAIDGPEAAEIADTLNVALARDPAAGTLARDAYEAALQAASGDYAAEVGSSLNCTI